MTDWPSITLVTPSFNQGRYLEATIRSVLAQGYPNLEYIVVDGGSADESVSIIDRYSDQLTWWVSEPDAGQTDAILKGFARSNGVIMNWLNSDDLLRPGALFAVASAYVESGAELIVGGDRHFTVDPDQPVSVFRPSAYLFPDCLRFWGGAFRYHQPCTFFTRGLYDRVGGLDLHLHYVMDYDLYCRMLASEGCQVRYLDGELSAFRLHEGAKTSSAKAGFIRELREVSRRYWPVGWGPQERGEMDKYTAECALFQGSEALRGRQWRQAAIATKLALHYAPWHTLRFAARRLLIGGGR
jgi:glycosyltransferase involved in cell wall biosynthesis